MQEQKGGASQNDRRKTLGLGENALKLCHVFQEHGGPFHSVGEHELINMLAQSVMSETVTVTNGILQRDSIGQQIFVDKEKTEDFQK